MNDYHAVAPATSACVTGTSAPTGEAAFLHVIFISFVQQRRRVEQGKLSAEARRLRSVGGATVATLHQQNKLRRAFLPVRKNRIAAPSPTNAKTHHPRWNIARIAVGIAPANSDVLRRAVNQRTPPAKSWCCSGGPCPTQTDRQVKCCSGGNGHKTAPVGTGSSTRSTDERPRESGFLATSTRAPEFHHDPGNARRDGPGGVGDHEFLVREFTRFGCVGGQILPGGAIMNRHLLLIGVINHITGLLRGYGTLLGRVEPGQRNRIGFERIGLLGKQRGGNC